MSATAFMSSTPLVPVANFKAQAASIVVASQYKGITHVVESINTKTFKPTGEEKENGMKGAFIGLGFDALKNKYESKQHITCEFLERVDVLALERIKSRAFAPS